MRGNYKKGVLRHTGMTPLYYIALLMATGLIIFKGGTICFLRDECKDSFFGNNQNGLLGPLLTKNNAVSELSPVRVLVNLCKYQRGPIDKTGGQMDNFAIPIGSYDEHQKIVTAKEINRNTSPPYFH